MKIICDVLLTKYPLLSFIIVFIIPDQEITTYYKNISDKIFIFCLNGSDKNTDNGYKTIFNYISQNNLFKIIPYPNENIKITNPTTKLCLVDGIPAVNYFKKYVVNNR
jgi:hypothetical protein